MAAPTTVKPIGDAIRELKTKMEDLALEGRYADADDLLSEIEELEDRQGMGELFVVRL